MPFNKKLVIDHRIQASKNPTLFAKANYIFNFGADILEDLFKDLKLNHVKRILIIGDRGEIVSAIIKKLKMESITISSINDLVELEFATDEFDLIVSFFDISWLNDLEIYLQIYNEIMSEHGVLLGVFIGEDSLINLKHKFLHLETKYNDKHYSHTSPFISAKEFAGLLQQYKYQNIIISIEELNIEYKNFMQLLRDLKNMGENNAIVSNSHYQIPKQIYLNILNDDTPFNEKFKIISFLTTKNRTFNIKEMDKLCHSN